MRREDEGRCGVAPPGLLRAWVLLPLEEQEEGGGGGKEAPGGEEVSALRPIIVTLNYQSKRECLVCKVSVLH